MAVILAEQIIEGFSYNSSAGVYLKVLTPSPCVLEIDKEYTVKWHETEYICTSFLANINGYEMIAVGNTAIAGGENTGVPFAIAYNSTTDFLNLFALTADSSHNIAIYTLEEEPETPEEPVEPELPTGIVLKDHAGNDIIYEGVKSIRIPTSDGGSKSFVAGEAVAVTVDLAMADGDMVLEPNENRFFSKVTVTKPETLIPENIAKGVNIGGVVGTLTSGNSDDEEEPSEGYTVTVIDYDGTIIKEKKVEAGGVFTIPNPPKHERLTFDGWSSAATITDGTVTVGTKDITIEAMYVTASGATELDIIVTDATGKVFGFNSVPTGTTSIDWGDGVVNTSATHTYSKIGEYTVKIYGVTSITGTSSSYPFVKSSYLNMLKRVFCSRDIANIGIYSFYNAKSLSEVTIPKTITTIGNYAFYSCYRLKYIVLPQVLTKIGDYAFRYCYNLKSMVIPKGVSTLGSYTFGECHGAEFYDFSNHSMIPTVSATNFFNGILSSTIIKVPVNSASSWKSAYGWTNYQKNIVGV